MVTDGFVARYSGTSHVDGLPAGEEAFLLCTLVQVEYEPVQLSFGLD
jgi:hypothetical protein